MPCCCMSSCCVNKQSLTATDTFCPLPSVMLHDILHSSHLHFVNIQKLGPGASSSFFYYCLGVVSKLDAFCSLWLSPDSQTHHLTFSIQKIARWVVGGCGDAILIKLVSSFIRLRPILSVSLLSSIISYLKFASSSFSSFYYDYRRIDIIGACGCCLCGPVGRWRCTVGWIGPGWTFFWCCFTRNGRCFGRIVCLPRLPSSPTWRSQGQFHTLVPSRPVSSRIIEFVLHAKVCQDYEKIQ